MENQEKKLCIVAGVAKDRRPAVATIKNVVILTRCYWWIAHYPPFSLFSFFCATLGVAQQKGEEG